MFMNEKDTIDFLAYQKTVIEKNLIWWNVL